jgi:hypothetical protein
MTRVRIIAPIAQPPSTLRRSSSSHAYRPPLVPSSSTWLLLRPSHPAPPLRLLPPPTTLPWLQRRHRRRAAPPSRHRCPALSDASIVDIVDGGHRRCRPQQTLTLTSTLVAAVGANLSLDAAVAPPPLHVTAHITPASATTSLLYRRLLSSVTLSPPLPFLNPSWHRP